MGNLADFLVFWCFRLALITELDVTEVLRVFAMVFTLYSLFILLASLVYLYYLYFAKPSRHIESEITREQINIYYTTSAL